MKRKTAKEILADSFLELAQTRSVDKITVKEITDNCGYSSATFYRHFKDKYDLIAWEYSRNLSDILSGVGVEGRVWKDTLIDIAEYFEKEKTYLSNLFLHTSGLESFMTYMTEINDSCMQSMIKQAAGTDRLDEKTKMYIHQYCHGTAALTCDWLLGTFHATTEELAEVFEKSLPEPLWKYIIEQ